MQGKYTDAEAWWDKARAEAIAGFGERDAHLAVVTSGLAEVFRLAGGHKFAAAEPLLRETVALTQQEYGEADVRAAHARQLLGQYLSEAGQHKAAVAELEAAAAAKKKVLGKGHVDYAAVRPLLLQIPYTLAPLKFGKL